MLYQICIKAQWTSGQSCRSAQWTDPNKYYNPKVKQTSHNILFVLLTFKHQANLQHTVSFFFIFFFNLDFIATGIFFLV